MRDLSNTIRILHNPRATPERYLRWQALLRRLLMVFFGLLSLGFLASSVANLVTAWQTGTAYSWQLFWHNPLSVLSLSPFLFLLRRDAAGRDLFDSVFQPFIRQAAVRQGALTTDDALAPLAEKQPEPPSAASVSERDVEIGPLTYPGSLHSRIALTLALSLFVVALSVGITTIVLLAAVLSGLNPQAGGIVALLALVTVGCAAFGRVALRRFRYVRQPFTVVVDSSGVSWRSLRSRRRQQRIRWDQAQALVCVQWRSYAVYTEHIACALLAPHAVLTWEITKGDRGSEWAAARDLAGLVSARTGLPLRDLSVALDEALGPDSTSAPAKPKIRFPLGTPGTPDAVPGLPPASAAAVVETDPRATRRMLRLGSLVALLAIPLTLVYGAGYGLQRIQPGYFAAYLARAEALHPLYRDSLAWFDSAWPTQHPGAGNVWSMQQPADGGSSRYTYICTVPVAQDACPPPHYGIVWGSRSFGDTIVEVTATQPATAGSAADDAGVGITFRMSSDSKTLLVFSVDQSGGWRDFDVASADSNLSYTSGHSDAIHRGGNATNRLSVIMHGNQFLCFVNGTFVGGYTDTRARASGAVGLFFLDGGQFSNFAVYPLPNDPPLWAS